jgi:hypothetical protein
MILYNLYVFSYEFPLYRLFRRERLLLLKLLIHTMLHDYIVLGLVPLLARMALSLPAQVTGLLSPLLYLPRRLPSTSSSSGAAAVEVRHYYCYLVAAPKQWPLKRHAISACWKSS